MPEPINLDEFITTAEAVAIVGCSEGYLRKLANAGQLERKKWLWRNFYRRDQIEQLAEDLRTKGEAQS